MRNPFSRTPSVVVRSTFCLLFILGTAGQGAANTIVVDSTNDGLLADNRCTLREAIVAANTDTAFLGCTAGSGSDIIELAFDAPHVLTLAGADEDLAMSGDLDILWHTTIRPLDPEVDLVRIDANGLDRVFHVKDSALLTLERIEVANGGPVVFGGGILNETDRLLRLDDSYVWNNEASLFGGGIYSVGAVALHRSRVSSNDAVSGGAVYMSDDSPVTLHDTSIASNAASADGGGIHALHVQIHRSTFDSNSADRHGGAIYLAPGDSSIVSYLENSVIAENEALENGGGLFVQTNGSLDLSNVTIAWNQVDSDENDNGDGGGVFVSTGTVTLRNSAIAGNEDQTFSGSKAPDCFGPLVSAGYNLLAAIDAACPISGDLTGNQTGTLAAPVNHQLGCIGHEPGQIDTIVPRPDSPVIDAGDPGGCLNRNGLLLGEDQLGHERPWDGPDPGTEATCDIGAIEYGSPPPGWIFLDGFESGDTVAWGSAKWRGQSPNLPVAWRPQTRGGGGGGCNDPELSGS